MNINNNELYVHSHCLDAVVQALRMIFSRGVSFHIVPCAEDAVFKLDVRCKS